MERAHDEPEPEETPWGRDAGGWAFRDGWQALLAWKSLLKVTLLGALAAASGAGLQAAAWSLGGGEPIAFALLLLAAASGWTVDAR